MQARDTGIDRRRRQVDRRWLVTGPAPAAADQHPFRVQREPTLAVAVREYETGHGKPVKLRAIGAHHASQAT